MVYKDQTLIKPGDVVNYCFFSNVKVVAIFIHNNQKYVTLKDNTGNHKSVYYNLFYKHAELQKRENA